MFLAPGRYPTTTPGGNNNGANSLNSNQSQSSRKVQRMYADTTKRDYKSSFHAQACVWAPFRWVMFNEPRTHWRCDFFFFFFYHAVR